MIEEPVLYFAPHPDDETIGAGAQFSHWPSVRLVHVTDGAPRNMQDALRHGFTTREAYAQARRNELARAMAIAGVQPEQCLSLDLVDQECSRNLVELTSRVTALLEQTGPRTVLCPPYEGGHPDHDSVAFAVHCACRIMRGQQRHAPRIIEYALYHSVNDNFRTGEFLPFGNEEVLSIRLSDEAAARKQRMFDCFVTQREILAAFDPAFEIFRTAPDYDFTEAPHAGRLNYEQFGWGVTGAQWRTLAAAAAKVVMFDPGDDTCPARVC